MRNILFVNGRFVRDRLISRALSEGYRAVLPHGVYPAALLFIEMPLEEVDVNVHPAKTEVRFRRAAAVADAVREAVRAALASAGYVRAESKEQTPLEELNQTAEPARCSANAASASEHRSGADSSSSASRTDLNSFAQPATAAAASQPRIDFPSLPVQEEPISLADWKQLTRVKSDTARDLEAIMRESLVAQAPCRRFTLRMLTLN